MDNTALCRVCFADNDKMRKLSAPLQKLYEKLTDAKLSSKDGRTSLFCSMCYAHLLRCYSFQGAATRAEHLLAQLHLNGAKNEGIISMIKRSSIHNYSCTPIQYTNIYNESERDSNTDRDNRYSTVRKRDSDNIDRDNSYSTVTKRDSDSISDHGGIEIDIDSDVKEERDSDIEGDDSVKRESEDEELCEKDGHNMRGSRKRASEKEEEVLRKRKKGLALLGSENESGIEILGAREKSVSRPLTRSCSRDHSDEATEDPFAEVLTVDNEVFVSEDSNVETDSLQTSIREQECVKTALESNLTEFFQNGCGMNDGASIIVSLKFISPEDFSAIVRCKIPDTNRDPPITDYTNFIDSFIRKFSTITKSNWIVRKTFPNLKRLIYRKVYTCQHSSFNKKNSDKLQRKSKRNLNCTANIDITIRKINKNTCRNSVFLRQGYNIIINIYHKHSHLVQIADSFSLLKCEPKLNADFVEYFENGMTPATARLFHETNLMENNSIHDISEVLSNAQVNPTARHVQYIYDKWRKNKNVDRTCRNFEVIETDCMKEISSAYN